jgi:hypothetical protein
VLQAAKRQKSYFLFVVYKQAYTITEKIEDEMKRNRKVSVFRVDNFYYLVLFKFSMVKTKQNKKLVN